MTTAFIFPGQGSQSIGMGRDLYETVPAARAIFEQADTALGMRLSRLCFEGPESELIATENAQPALLTMSVALLAAGGWVDEHGRSLMDIHTEAPLFVAGHSLGEYSALVAAGALDFADALQLVRRRGQLMAAAHNGGMVAVLGLETAVAEQICADVCTQVAYHDQSGQPQPAVVIANYNAPGQLVLSGSADALQSAVQLAQERGARRVLPIKVSGAFHSPLMAGAAEGLRQALEGVRMLRASVPLMANVDARPVQSPEELRNELIAQITAPVRWIACVEAMAQAGVQTFVEIGAGSVLTGLVKRIVPGVGLRTLNSAAQLAQAVGVAAP